MKPYLLKHFTPSRIFISSFAGAILVGAFLLWSPLSSPDGGIRFIDALFTSTSAVCVTGLSVLDLGKDMTFSGQVLTLFLFQIGGLGIISFSVLLFELMGRGISFKEREIVQTTFLTGSGRDFGRLLRWVFLITLVIESIGTVVLFFRFSVDFPPGQALYYALFHAVSAFNNCGFCLFSNSLIDYQGDPIINVIIMILIVLGGIGFIVQRRR